MKAEGCRMSKQALFILQPAAFVLCCFGDLACFDATGADLHPLNSALRTLDANGLQVGIEATARAIVSV